MTGSTAGEPVDADAVVAGRVRELREQRGWSQQELAVRMKAAGVGWIQSTVAKTEAGFRPVRLTEAVGLAHVFEVELKDLVQPSVHPFVLRMQKETARISILGERLTRAKQNLDAWTMEGWAANHRFDAVERMSAFLEDPDAEGLDDAVVDLYRYTKGDEWIEILEEVGIDGAWISAKRAEFARRTFGDDENGTVLARGLNDERALAAHAADLRSPEALAAAAEKEWEEWRTTRGRRHAGDAARRAADQAPTKDVE